MDEIKKTAKDLKVEIGSLKKTKAEGSLEMKNLESQDTDVSSTGNKIQKKELRH